MPAWYSGDWSLGDTVLMMLPYTFQSVTSPKCTYGILKFYYALHVFKFATKSLRMHWTVSLWESPGTAILVLITCSVATSENLMKPLLTSNNITCKWKIQPMAQDQSWAIGEEQSWTSEKLIIFNTNKRAWQAAGGCISLVHAHGWMVRKWPWGWLLQWQKVNESHNGLSES